jgi:D-sedoheptulose 7-phosphate isomerase
MRNFIDAYEKSFLQLLGSIEATEGKDRPLPLREGIEKACGIIRERTAAGGTVYFIGNGGSAAIASHMATDFWKNGGMRAMAFNDSSLLTCIGNDYGYPHVFEKPLEMFLRPGDALIAISSSGRSQNILKGVAAAQAKQCPAITMSGFTADNPLRATGAVNFFVPSGKYGPVEVIHQYLVHFILDALMANESECRG